METIRFKLTGVSPLLMHNARLADPTDPITKELKKLTKKKNKTDNVISTSALQARRAMLKARRETNLMLKPKSDG